MRAWLKHHPSAAWVLGASLLLPLLLALFLAVKLLVMGFSAQSDIERLRPGAARMAGIIEAAEQIRQARFTAAENLQRLVYPASMDQAGVSAAMQRRLREVIQNSGMTIADSRIMPVCDTEQFEEISLRINAAGDLAALDAALAGLAAFEPRVLIENIDMRPASRKNDVQRVRVSFTLKSLRGKS